VYNLLESEMLDCLGFQFSTHTVRRMLEKGITSSGAEYTLKYGEVIREYPDDRPYPSKLVLYFINSRPIHVVTAQNNYSK
jgi:hypothetical protein